MNTDACRFYLLFCNEIPRLFLKLSDTPTGGKTHSPVIPSQVDFQTVSKLRVGNIPTYKDFVPHLHNKSDGVLSLTAHHGDFNCVSVGPAYKINLR